MAITYTERYKTVIITPKVGAAMTVTDSATSNEATAVIRSALRKEQLRFHTIDPSPSGDIKQEIIVPWHNVRSVEWSLGEGTAVTQKTCFAEAGGRN